MARKLTDLEKAKRAALKEYARLEEIGTPLAERSPASATKAAAKASGIPASRLVSVVADLFYLENGSRAPISFPRAGANGPSKKAVATAVRKARDEGGRLARWEVVAVRLAVGLGKDPRAVSVAAVKALYDLSGADRSLSYTGRGTRAAAPETRTDETAEVVA